MASSTVIAVPRKLKSAWVCMSSLNDSTTSGEESMRNIPIRSSSKHSVRHLNISTRQMANLYAVGCSLAEAKVDSWVTRLDHPQRMVPGLDQAGPPDRK